MITTENVILKTITCNNNNLIGREHVLAFFEAVQGKP